MKHYRSLLFMPGNNPGMLASAGALGADAAIFDLEDAVARTEQDAARILVRNALTELRPEGIGVVVRINALDTPFWQDDIAEVVKGGPDFILQPKCTSPEDARTLIAAIEEREREYGAGRKPIRLLTLLETAAGIENAFAIASAHPKLAGMQLGAEDLTLELGAKRTPGGEEILYARTRLIMACKAAGVKSLDTPYPYVTDLEGLEKDAAFSAQLGFDGKTVISPQHVAAVNRAFTPPEEQLRWARRVMAVARKAEEEGKGAVSLDGMMIDLPIIKRAQLILSRAGEAPVSFTEDTAHA